VIMVAIGGNLDSRFGPPLQTCRAACAALEARGMAVTARSRWYRTAPVPVSDQPWFVNGVVAVATDLGPERVLDVLHAIEGEFGRVRTVRNAARIVDLDLLAHGQAILRTPRLELPHPRLHERGFVLLPLADVAPDWRHPVSGMPVAAMIAALPPGQAAEPIPE